MVESYESKVFYVKTFDEEGTLVKEGKDALGKTSRFENRVYLTANEDGGLYSSRRNQ